MTNKRADAKATIVLTRNNMWWNNLSSHRACIHSKYPFFDEKSLDVSMDKQNFLVVLAPKLCISIAKTLNKYIWGVYTFFPRWNNMIGDLTQLSSRALTLF